MGYAHGWFRMVLDVIESDSHVLVWVFEDLWRKSQKGAKRKFGQHRPLRCNKGHPCRGVVLRRNEGLPRRGKVEGLYSVA